MTDDDPDGQKAVEARLAVARLKKPPPPPETIIRSSTSWPTYARTWGEKGNWFWTEAARRDPRYWPRDRIRTNSVFLGRAVLSLGRAMFPDDWNDNDPSTPIPSGESVVAARRSDSPVIDLTRHYEATIELKKIDAWSRAISVFNALIAAAEKRVLTWRHMSPIGAAPMQDCPDHWFDGETFEQFFYQCTADPVSPFRKLTTPWNRHFHTLFVDRDGLDRLVHAEAAKVAVSSEPALATGETGGELQIETAQGTALSRNKGRPGVRQRVLLIYRDRLLARSVEKMTKAEAVAIWRLWSAPPQQPTDRRIGEHIGKLHQLAAFDAKGAITHSSASAIIALIDQELGSAFEAPQTP